MSNIRTLTRRIEKLEQKEAPPDIPPFHIIKLGIHSQAEIDAMRADVADYRQRNPDGPPAFTIEVMNYSDNP